MIKINIDNENEIADCEIMGYTNDLIKEVIVAIAEIGRKINPDEYDKYIGHVVRAVTSVQILDLDELVEEIE